MGGYACRACGLLFGSLHAFDGHRFGPMTDRACLMESMLLARGWSLDSRGRWRTPAAERLIQRSAAQASFAKRRECRLLACQRRYSARKRSTGTLGSAHAVARRYGACTSDRGQRADRRASSLKTPQFVRQIKVPCKYNDIE